MASGHFVLITRAGKEQLLIALEDNICLLVLIIPKPHKYDIALQPCTSGVADQILERQKTHTLGRRQSGNAGQLRRRRTVFTQTFFRILPRM